MGRITGRALEILSPAGDLERLRAAVDFGADAVYLAGRRFGMRAAAKNFGSDDLKAGVEYAHKNGAKVYVTCNTVPHNDDIKEIPAFLEEISQAGADAVIASDLGVIRLIKKYAPELKLHVSVQAGIVNFESARFFYDLGASRIVLARKYALKLQKSWNLRPLCTVPCVCLFRRGACFPTI